MLALAAALWRRPALVGLGGLVVVAALGALLLPETRELLDENANRLTSGRIGLAEEGGDLFRADPLLGVGLGGFGEAAGATAGEERRLASHTAPIATAAELGSLGLLALVAGTAAVALAVLRPARPRRHRVLRLVLAVQLLAVAVHSLFYNALFEDPMAWGLVALLAVVAAPDDEREWAGAVTARLRGTATPGGNGGVPDAAQVAPGDHAGQHEPRGEERDDEQAEGERVEAVPRGQHEPRDG
jgi:O-antigen ligase